MAPSQQLKERDGVISTLDVFIQILDIAKNACGIPPAQVAFGSASVLLAMIRVRSPSLCEDELPTRQSRTRFPTTRTTSSLGGLAVMYAKRSMED